MILLQNATLSANGHDGGQIIIRTYNGDINLNSTVIQTNGSMGRGGSIGIAADDNTLISASTIEAIGYRQGGLILIGNDARDGTLPFSIFTSLDRASTINASVVVGNAGGWIETSGHTLNLLSSINAGRGGIWLLDPYDITIDSTMAGTIVTSLNAGTSVTIQTTNSSYACSHADCSSGLASGNGDITVASNIITGAMSDHATLTLSAYRSIIVNAGITIDATQNSNTKKLNIVLGASNTDAGGIIYLKSGSSIKSNGGYVVMGGGVDPSTGYAKGLNSNTYNGVSGINTSLATSGVVVYQALITSGVGNVTINGDGYSTTGVGVYFYGNTDSLNTSGNTTGISTTTGSVTIRGKSVSSQGVYLHY
jgi:hypothetical protein